MTSALTAPLPARVVLSRGRFGVAVDLMVPEALSVGSSRRSARLPIHGNRAARRTTGLEPALVDNAVHEIVAFDAADPLMVRLRVAGPAALLVAKVTKIEERRDTPGRHQPKDGLDVLRLLQATPTEAMAQRLANLARDPLAGAVTTAAIAALQRDGRDPQGLVANLAGAGVGNLTDPDTVRGSVAILIEELLTALVDLG